MKEISSLTVKQFRIYEPDRLPFRIIWSGAGRKVVAEAFQFSDISHNESTNEWIFRGGSVVLGEDDDPVVIEVLQLADRRVVLSIEGSTDEADQVMEQIAAVFEKMDRSGRWRGAEPIVKTDETTAVLSLDLDWTDFFPAALSESVSKHVESLSSPLAVSRLRSFRLGFRIGFELRDDKVKDYGVTLSEKTLAIEPKANTPLSERLYFTSSPNDSATHLELVDTIEKTLKTAKVT